MIIKETEALARLHSADNLINRLRATRGDSSRKGAMGLFGVASRQSNEPAVQVKSVNPFLVPTVVTETVEVSEHNTNQEITPPAAPLSTTPTLDNLLENADTKIKLAQVHDLALTTLHEAVTVMRTKLDDIKPDKLPSVIGAMGKTVNDIRKEQNESIRNRDGKNVNIIFYTPEQRKLTDYAVIDV